MKTTTLLSTFLGAALLWLGTGCDTINQSQYQVRGLPNIEGVRVPLTAGQRALVREVLASVAQELRFQERTERSRVPNVIAAYGEEDNLNPITFLAYQQEGFVVVDIFHAPTTLGETKRYRQARELIHARLQERVPKAAVITSGRHQHLQNTAPAPAESGQPGTARN